MKPFGRVNWACSTIVSISAEKVSCRNKSPIEQTRIRNITDNDNDYLRKLTLD